MADAMHGCQPCGSAGMPACKEGMVPSRCDGQSRYDAARNFCDAVRGPGDYGKPCGNDPDPKKQCNFELRCLAKDPREPDEKACLCETAGDQCGPRSVCAGAATQPQPRLPPSPRKKDTGRCDASDPAQNDGHCAPDHYFCYDGPRGCNKTKDYWESVPDCKRYCQTTAPPTSASRWR